MKNIKIDYYNDDRDEANIILIDEKGNRKEIIVEQFIGKMEKILYKKLLIDEKELMKDLIEPVE